MSYTKTNWRDGDVITASKMNKIENQLQQISQQNNTVDNTNLIIDLGDVSYDNWQIEIFIDPELTLQQLSKAIIKMNLIGSHGGGLIYSNVLYVNNQSDSDFYMIMDTATLMNGNEIPPYFYYPDTGRFANSQLTDDTFPQY